MAIEVAAGVRRRTARFAPEGFRAVSGSAALVAPLVLAGLLLQLLVESWPAISHFGPGFVLSRDWNPVASRFGALPFIYGTLVSSLLALALATPVAIGTALFLAETKGARFRAPVGVAVELLAAIPSVVYGIWALYVMAPWVLVHVELPLHDALGFVPLFAGVPRQTSMLSAALVLAVMILPTLAAISRDVIRAASGGVREAAMALGATWWETTWKVVLPAARGGIFGAVILALGRALGETIAVTMVIGNRPELQPSLFAPAYTLASVIANEFTEATGALYIASLIALGLILIVLSLLVNVFALAFVRGGIQGGRVP